MTIPELSWHARAIPYYDYLLKDAEPGAVLAGGHCVPVRIPQAGRFIWHKLYSSRARRGEPEKAKKDYQHGRRRQPGSRQGTDPDAHRARAQRATPSTTLGNNVLHGGLDFRVGARGAGSSGGHCVEPLHRVLQKCG